jgi:hypothetical protein
MFNFFKRNACILLLIFFSLVIYHTWFFTLGIIKTGDWGYFYKETMVTLNIHWFSLWLGDIYGRVLIDVGQAPVYALYGYLSKFLNFDFVINQRLLYLYPIALFTPLFSYFFLRSLKFNSIASFIGALIYSFNTYFLVLQTGHMTLMGAFCFAPLVIAIYIKTLNTLSFPRALITGILLSVEFAYEPRATYIIVGILLFYAIYFLFFIQRKLIKENIFRMGIIAFLPVLTLGFLNVYWILGLLHVQSNGVGDILGRPLFGDEFYNILYSFTLFHPFWTGQEIAVFRPQPIPFYFWIIPILAILGLYLNRRNKQVLFFGLVSILGIFFSKQIAHPFEGIYPWFYIHFPGFNAFREASKFYFLVDLGYSVLIAAFVNLLWENRSKTKLYMYSKYLMTFLIAGIFLLNTKPLVTGEYKTLFVTRKINNDYLIVKNFIKNQNEYFRSLWIPASSHFSYYSDSHPLSDLSIFQIVDKPDKKELKLEEKLKPGEIQIRLLNKSYANHLLNVLSVKYIFIPLREPVNDDDPFFFKSKERNYYEDQLNKILFLHKIDIGTKELVVYENYGYRQHIYITNNQESIYSTGSGQVSKDQEYKTIDYKFINPTQYKFTVKNVVGSFYLNFSEAFHPDWRIRIGDFNWWDVLFSKNYFIDNKNHLRNDALLNSYILNPKSICPPRGLVAVGAKRRDNGCTKNMDGSYDIEGTLYFAPQSYLYLGLIVSGSTLVLVVGYLIFELGKGIQKRTRNRDKDR